MHNCTRRAKLAASWSCGSHFDAYGRLPSRKLNVNSKPSLRHGRPYLRLTVTFLLAAAGGAAIRYTLSRSEASAASSQSLNPYTFTPYILTSKEPVSSTSAVFTLRRPNQTGSSRILADSWTSQIWSVQIKQPQLQIARSYTPLPPFDVEARDGSDTDDDKELRLLIRREENGEVSGYLHNLPEGTTVELRGPHSEFELPSHTREVVFLAGGTGISPALQVAHALQGRKSVRMQILWANRKSEDCRGADRHSYPYGSNGRLSGWRSLFGLEEPIVTGNPAPENRTQNVIVRQLEGLKDRWNTDGHQRLSVEYFVDEEKTHIESKSIARRLRDSARADATAQEGARLILISGPDGFVEYWAGSKKWEAGREVQGPLGGLLSELDLSGWTVWKL